MTAILVVEENQDDGDNAFVVDLEKTSPDYRCFIDDAIAHAGHSGTRIPVDVSYSYGDGPGKDAIIESFPVSITGIVTLYTGTE